MSNIESLKKAKEELALSQAEKEQIIDAEVIKSEELDEQAEETEQKPPKCLVQLGYNEDGGLIFEVRGEDTSLLTVEGLLSYAQREMGRYWEPRLGVAGYGQKIVDRIDVLEKNLDDLAGIMKDLIDVFQKNE
jgi:hypothetical protein